MSQKDTFSITAQVAQSIMEHDTEIAQQMRESVSRHSAKVAHELDIISAMSNVDRARHAIIFSLVSPQCKFDKNVAVTAPLVTMVMSGNHTAHDYTATLTAHGIGLQNAKGKTIADAADFIRGLTDGTVTRALLTTVRGIGLKASAMAIALYDQQAPVYTLDVWMCRGLLELCGLGTGAKPIITDSAYKSLESWLVDLAQATCPQVSIFNTQWSMWNDFGFNGVHQVHTPIFGL